MSVLLESALSSKPSYKGTVMEGRAFGKWTVLDKALIKKYRKSTRYFWLCRCKCGFESYISAQFITNGKSRQCKSCHNSKKGGESPVWKGYGEVPSRVLSALKPERASRTLDFDINCKDLHELWILQDRKCAYTGRILVMADTASVDRIDSDNGYIRGNVQWVHKDVNKMKWSLSEDTFITFCKEVASHRS